MRYRKGPEWKRLLQLPVLAALCVCILSGCGGGGNGSVLTADETGGITEKITEELDGGSYTQEELEQFIAAQTAAYEGGPVTMESCKVSSGKTEIVMKYPSWRDYAAFNQVDFFLGTISEAETAGYDINQDWLDRSGKAVEREKISEKKNDWKMLILEETVDVKLPGKILYRTDNVSVTGRKSARVDTVLSDRDGSGETAGEEGGAVTEASASSAVSAGETVSAPDSPSVINRYATVADRYAYIIFK